MSWRRVVAFVAFIVFIALVVGVTAARDALAGEKFRGRTVWYTVKWEQMDVGDEKGHIYAL